MGIVSNTSESHIFTQVILNKPVDLRVRIKLSSICAMAEVDAGPVRVTALYIDDIEQPFLVKESFDEVDRLLGF